MKKNKEEAKIVNLIDQVAAFRKFKDTIDPELQKLVLAGAEPDEIFKKFKSLAAARLVTTALTDPDPAKAMAAIKDIIDRTQGKPTERKEVTHRMAKLKEKELDALIASKLDDDES